MASSQIMAELGLDESRFTKGLKSAESAFSSFGKKLSSGSVGFAAGDQIEKNLERSLGLKNALQSISIALGLSIQNIAEKLASMFTGGAQDSWRRGLSAAEDAARTIEQATTGRLSSLRQIEQLEKAIARNTANESSARQDNSSLLSKSLLLLGAGVTPFNSGLGAKIMSFGADASKETEAEAFARSQEATAARLAAELRISALKEKAVRDQERIDAARRSLGLVGASDEKLMVAALQDAKRIQDQLYDAKRKGSDTTEIELAYIAKMREAKEIQLKIDKSQDDLAAEKVRDFNTELQLQMRLIELKKEESQIGESAEARIARLRSEAADEIRRSSTANLDTKVALELRIDAQTKLNQAKAEELSLEESIGSAMKDNRRDPARHYGPDENAAPSSNWELKFGKEIAARNAALNAMYGEWGATAPSGSVIARDLNYNARFAKNDARDYNSPSSFMNSILTQPNGGNGGGRDDYSAEQKAAAEGLKDAGSGLNEAAEGLKKALEVVNVDTGPAVASSASSWEDD